MTSFILNFNFNIAGIKAQKAPPMKPKRRSTGICIVRGSVGHFNMNQVAKSAPKYSCPSAPMFHNLLLRATATASPVKIRGILFIIVSDRP